MIKYLLIFFLCAANTLSAQTIKTWWSKDTIKIGEPVILQILIQQAPKGFKIKPVSDLIECDIRNTHETLWKPGGELEIEKFEDSTYTKNGTLFWKGEYTILAWDSAIYRFPEIQLNLSDSTISKQAPPLVVVFQKKKIDDSIYEVSIQSTTDSWYYLKKYWWALFLLVAVIVLIFILNKRRRIKPKERLSLKQQTLNDLANIKAKEAWLNGKEDQHYVAFSGLMRAFFGTVFELNLLERTTAETVELLKLKKVDSELILRIDRLLKEADLIKFSKTLPDDLTVRNSLNRFEELVVELSPLDLIA